MFEKCWCPHCVMELKKSCMGPDFCRPCSIKKNKICPVCKAEYAVEYDECPACAVAAKYS